MKPKNIFTHSFSLKHLTSLRAFRYLESFSDKAYLLENVHTPRQAHSFLGVSPTKVLRIVCGRVYLEINGECQELFEDPLVAMNRFIDEHQMSSRMESLRGEPVYGGVVGYLGYDCVRFVENIPMPESSVAMDDAILMLFPVSVTFEYDHEQVIITGVVIDDNSRESTIATVGALKAELERLNEIPEDLESTFLMNEVSAQQFDEEELKTYGEVHEREHCEKVEKIKEYIRQGDIFQAVYSIRFNVPASSSELAIYSYLKSINPSPYMFYLKLGKEVLMGASPETLLRYDGQYLETHPIAGTRRRGRDAQDDERLSQDLLSDAKETAEHLMLVDLGRNDLSKVSKIGTVKMNRFMGIEKFSHVMHIVSVVQGEKSDEYTPFEAMLSCFPAGTLSGAPKVRAMQIISELEKTARGSYGGAVLFSGFSGQFDSCITIRSIYVRDKIAHIQAGGGIVADSNPKDEYQEIINKAMSPFKAIKLANQQNSTMRGVNI